VCGQVRAQRIEASTVARQHYFSPEGRFQPRPYLSKGSPSSFRDSEVCDELPWLPDLVYCGDNKGAKRTAARLISDAGFNPVDIGSLSIARYIEPFSLLAAERAYNSSDGPAIACRFERFPNR